MTEHEHNPQAEQFNDQSMLRTLAAQAQAIWPQERALVARYDIPASGRVLDVGCGNGEIGERLLQLLPEASLLGIDINPAHLQLAREKCARFAGRYQFQTGDAYHLPVADDRFDLAVCRHLLQAIPQPEVVVGELFRVTRPGGWIHLLAEDYSMMHFAPTERDCDLFWHRGPRVFAAKSGTDLMNGRTMWALLRSLGCVDVTVDYVVVDTVRVPRATFAAIWEAWRDGYAQAIHEASGMAYAEVVAHFDEMIAAIRRPDGYGVWQVPVIAGRVPRA